MFNLYKDKFNKVKFYRDSKILDLSLLLSNYIEMYCTSSNELSFDFRATILQIG